jgi:hypothetical protein
VGAGAEILAGLLAAVVLPPLAARIAGGEAGLAPVAGAIEGVIAAFSGVGGIGVLSVAGALAAHVAFRTPPFPRGLALLSVPVWGVGVAAAGATFAGGTGSVALVAWLFLPLLALFAAGTAGSFFRPPAGR